MIEGYAALFGVPDAGRDIILPGAFRRSLRELRGRPVRMLWQHDTREPIGLWTELKEDAHGLFVRGHIAKGVQRAGEALALVRQGAVDGLSIGFKTVRGRTDRNTGLRTLTDVDLWEVSVVTFPMIAGARVISVS